MIKIIISDVDGCIVKEDKTVIPVLEDLTSQEPQLSALNRLLGNHPNVVFSLCTNRSLSSGLRIAELSGTNGVSAFEGGNIIYNPLSGESYLIVNKDESLKHLIPVLAELQKWYKTIDDNILIEELGIERKNLRRLSDRKTILTYEVLPFNAPPVSGAQILKVIQKRFFNDKIAKYFSEGKLNITPSASALDIGLNIDKSHAVKHILRIYGISSEHALSIGDSYHSDFSMFEETAYRGLPSNANVKLKESVNGRSGSFISEKSHCEGILEVLNYFLK